MLRPALAALAVVLLVVAGLVAWRVLDEPTEFERAVGYLPPDTLRVTYTDWAAVRGEAGGAKLDSGSSARQVDGFLDRAFEQDLTSTSALAGSSAALADRYGVSPLDASWELLGQSREGQVVVLAVGEGVDLGGVEQRLRRLGYDEPAAGPGQGGVWEGSADLVASIDPALTPVQQNVAVLPDDRLVLMSDNAASVSDTADIVRGNAPGLDAADLTDLAGEPVTATLWASDFACEDLSMAGADPEDQQVAASLVDRVGGVSPLTGLVVAKQPARSIVVGMLFESSDQASENLQARVDLAAGEAPGQGGTFADRFAVTSGERSGRAVVLELRPKQDAEFVFSDITAGPVLFATC